MKKHKTKKGKSTKITNSNKSNINITIHNTTDKKHKRGTRSKKGEAYQAPKQNPKKGPATITSGGSTYLKDSKSRVAGFSLNILEAALK